MLLIEILIQKEKYLKMEKAKPELTVITILAAAQVLHEAMDDLQETPYYRQDVKVATKRLEEKLTKVLDNNITKMWQIDEEVMRMVQDGITEVTKELSTMDPVRIASLGELLKSGQLEFIDE